jgi:hypothetical protein
MTAPVLNRQSLFDLALQHCGSVEAAIDIALLNGLSLSDSLEVGSELLLPPVLNKPVADYYRNRNITPATALTTDTLVGIGYWTIGIDFIVS